MRNRFKSAMLVALFLVSVGVVLSLTEQPTAGQARGGQAPVAGQGRGQAPAPGPAYRLPRSADGKPDMNGIWQAMNTANWDLEDHGQAAGAFWQLGAIGAVPPGQGVVEGGPIPYKPDGLARRKKNFENRMKADPYERELGDPELKCYLPGIPRATYMPYPFQIVQSNRDILFVYQYASANRLVHMGKPQESPTDTWMGWSNGRWDGETLVIDVKAFNGQAWFDRAGNQASDTLHVVERYTATDKDHLNYEATIEDPNTFTRPWKISMPLYRRVERNIQLFDFKCVEFSEEALYGRLKKQPAPAAK